MKKLNLKGLKHEMSTTGTGASFAAGEGEQYSTPKAFKKCKNEVGEPFSTPSPSIPNRKSKVMDFVKIFEKAIKELNTEKKYNPVTDLTSSQADAGLNTGYDMDSLDAASVMEAKIGDVKTTNGIKSTVTDIDSVTGAVTWSIDYAPAFDSVFKEFDELRRFIKDLDRQTDDPVIDDISAIIVKQFNRYRTHIRNTYPDSYKRSQMNEARYSQFKNETKLRTPTEQIHRAVREIRRKIDEITKVVAHTERMKSELKSSSEGMSYLKRTHNAINTISEKIQDLNNRIKGLTE